jgi:hypothetical protein
VSETWRAWRRLPFGKRRLAVEAAVLLSAARFGVAVLPARAVSQWVVDRVDLRSVPAAADGQGLATIAWAVSAAASRLPFHISCLVEALAARHMLRRRGYSARLRLGVPLHPGTVPFRAHAWVECEGQVVVGGGEDLARYSVLRAPGA